MYGSSVGVLSVYLRIRNNDGTFSQSPAIWTMKNSHGNHWNLAHVEYEGGNTSVSNFIIEGYANRLSAGDIALGT